MKTDFKEEYLVAIKNGMIFCSSHKFVDATLEDISSIIDSGIDDSKTEAEVYEDLGTSKMFVQALAENGMLNKSGKIWSYVFMIVCVSVMIFSFVNVDMRSALLATIFFPVLTWYMQGGRCLYRIKKDRLKNYKKYIPLLITILLVGDAEQIIVLLLGHDMIAEPSSLKNTYNISWIYIFVLVIILGMLLFKTNRGYYLSVVLEYIILGAIYTSLLYNDFFVHYDVPALGTYYNIWLFPYAVGWIFGTAALIFLKKMEAFVWTHK